MELNAKATFDNVLNAKAVFEQVNVVSGDIDAINTALDAVNEEEIGTTPAEKIAFIDGWKEDIKAAITAKGVDMTDVVPDDYDDKIAEIRGATGNATVNQVLIGATFSNATASDLTGTMPNIGQQNITPTASDIAISEGYHDGTGVVSGAPIASAKAAVDAANEEPSADLDAGIALVSGNYAAIKAAIAAKSVDMAGVKPSGYDNKIAQAVSEAYWAFNSVTKTIAVPGHNTVNGLKKLVIPEKIANVDVLHIGDNAFYAAVGGVVKPTSLVLNSKLKTVGINSFRSAGLANQSSEVGPLVFPDTVESIGIYAFVQCTIAAVVLPTNPLYTVVKDRSFLQTGLTKITIPAQVTTVETYAFATNNIAEIIIPANVAIADEFSFGTYGAAFKTLYDGNGKLAGTYKYAGGAWTKTA